MIPRHKPASTWQMSFKSQCSLGELSFCATNYQAWTACSRIQFSVPSASNLNSPRLSSGYEYIVATPLVSLGYLHAYVMLGVTPWKILCSPLGISVALDALNMCSHTRLLFFLIKIMFLWRWNSFCIKLTVLKLNIHYIHHVLQPPFTSSSKILSSSQKESPYLLSSCSLFFLPKPLATINICAVSPGIYLLWIFLYKWNHTLCDLLCLASLTLA